MASRATRRVPRWLLWTLGTLVAIVAVLTVAFLFFVDEPLRQRIEANMNAQLKGYTVQIGRAHLDPLGFAVELKEWSIIEDANPKPPLGYVPYLRASVQWQALLHGKLVADFRIDNPTLHLDEKQGEHEVKDPTPVKQRGWQEAFEQIYPLKINEIKVVEGDMTYAPGKPFKPLHMTHVNLIAGNIRNVHSRDREYPSDLHVDAFVFDRGTLRIDGHADFLAEPYAGLQTDVALTDLPLDYLTGVVKDYAAIRNGTFDGWGAIEYAPKIKRVDLQEITITGADADYIVTKENQSQQEQMRQQTVQAAKETSNDPGVQLRAKRVRMTRSALGTLDKTANPNYRVFLTDVDLTVQNFSNQKAEGIGTVDATGKFMGSGPSTLHAVFHPETKSPDFDLAVRLEDTDLTTMNDLLRAKANIDVTAGKFAFYSELGVRNNNVTGYVKPLFHDIKVYDKAQDREKPFLHRVYEGVVGGIAKLLENPRTAEIATKTSVSGPIENPNTSTWQIVGRLVQNAFFKAILPGLERSQG